ncbi:MAG TPA: APC family permease [Mycobacteriales bacterium]|nr:APC family permease [Mycobacteriales bacterium]
MTTATETHAPGTKGLKSGALGLWSTVVVGVASTAPAYSLAATLGFIVLHATVHTPIIVVLAFIPMWMISVGYSELNKADPDCGTTFTWATRAFGPKTGWYAGGWGIVASDVLIMASLAQIAGQYVFLLFGADRVGSNPASGWVLLVGLGWLALMTYICYRGIEVSASIQKVLLAIESGMLVVFAAAALIRVAAGQAPAGHLTPAWGWLNPFGISSVSAFVAGFILMIFIYWGWDTAVSVNEETSDPRRTPGRAAVISTVVLLAIYFVVTFAAQSYAGLGTHGIGLENPDNASDVLSVLGHAVFGHNWVGTVFLKLLLLMVLSSAAASTLTTIMPTARTTLSMAVYRALPAAFGRVHKEYMTPTVSTVAMGGVSAALYVIFNYLSHGNVIADSVTSCGVFIALYYGTTGIACTWYYRRTLTRNARDFFMQGVVPTLGAAILFFVGGWSMYLNWLSPTSSNPAVLNIEASYTSWQMPFPPHWDIGGVALLVILAAVVGVIAMVAYNVARPAFFRREVLNAATPTLVPDSMGLPIDSLHSLRTEDVPDETALVTQLSRWIGR